MITERLVNYMELFNKYKNKDFICITNYINSCVNDMKFSLTDDELSAALLGSAQNTFHELITAILNRNKDGLDPKHPNANLFINRSGRLLPIRSNYIPVRPSIAEKAWLLYILQDKKAKLFLQDEIITELISKLKSDLSLPDISRCIDIRNLGPAAEISFSDETKYIFKLIVAAIKEHKTLVVTNTAFNGQTYKNQTVIPYKLEYTPQFDSFSLSAYNLDAARPIKMNLLNLKKVSLGEPIPDYDKFLVTIQNPLIQR